MNLVVLLGNLTRDPQLRTTGSGTPVASFTVACQRRFRNQNGEQEADFIDCVAWRQTAEFVSKYFRKGSKICVEGSIRTRSYEDKQGQRRYVTEVVCENVEFGSSRSNGGGSTGGGGQSQYQAAPQRSASPPQPSVSVVDDVFEDDVDTDFQPLDDSELPF